MLQGKKTYIMGACIALATLAKCYGWIDENAYLTLLGLFNAGGLAALRAGVKNG